MNIHNNTDYAISTVRDKLWFIFTGYFVFFMFLVFCGVYGILAFNRSQAILILKNEAEKQVETQKERIISSFNSIKSDLLFLPRLNEMLRFKELNDDYDRESIELEFLEFAKSKKVYDQIRYIDTSGMERIRINYNNGDPVIVDKDSLQNKSNRYYVEKSLLLNKGDMYASPLDLNKENGVIEIPHKPMIRFGLAVFSNNGDVKGAIVLNYLADTILQELKDATKVYPGSFYLVNQDGHWLSHDDPDYEWGFMYHEKTDLKFSSEHPKFWNKALQQEKLQVEYDDELITSTLVNPLKGTLKDEYLPTWFIVNTISFEGTNLSMGRFYRRLIIYTLLFSVIIGIMTFLLARAVKQRNIYHKRLRHSALYDNLTDLPNRKLLIERAQQIVKNAKRHKDSYAILFIDLDGFKNINDNMGHDAGDELIKQVAERMNRSIRIGDTAARIGGDEFVVLLPRVEDSIGAKIVAEKILSKLCLEFALSKGVAKIGASIGVVISRPDDDKTIDDVMKKADELMYKVKKSGKCNIEVYETLKVSE